MKIRLLTLCVQKPVTQNIYLCLPWKARVRDLNQCVQHWPGAINHTLLLSRVIDAGAWTWASLCTWRELKGGTERKHLQKRTSLSESFPSVIFIAE